jgi:hypothetical protein
MLRRCTTSLKSSVHFNSEKLKGGSLCLLIMTVSLHATVRFFAESHKTFCFYFFFSHRFSHEKSNGSVLEHFCYCTEPDYVKTNSEHETGSEQKEKLEHYCFGPVVSYGSRRKQSRKSISIVKKFCALTLSRFCQFSRRVIDINLRIVNALLPQEIFRCATRHSMRKAHH